MGIRLRLAPPFFIQKGAIYVQFFKRKLIRPSDKIPLDSLRLELHTYDTTRPRIDELVFVRNLCIKYGCQREELLRTIRYVRRGNRRKK